MRTLGNISVINQIYRYGKDIDENDIHDSLKTGKNTPALKVRSSKGVMSDNITLTLGYSNIVELFTA